MNDTPLLSFDHVSMQFDTNGGFLKKKQQIHALSDINLDIFSGDIVAVVGESGCGKTTIGKLICDVYKPSEGKVLYNGADIHSISPKSQEYKDYRMAVQMVHQDSYAALNPQHTIFKSLSYPILAHGIAANRLEALDQLVKLFNLVGLTPAEDFLFKYPHQLSGGQRQRTLLARALSVKPKLIVADEPVSMVDVSLRISLLDLMSKMNKELGVSFVYITHDLATARYIAQNGRLLVMYLGKIVEFGDLNAVLSDPCHPYLQALLSAIPAPDPRIKSEGLLLKDADMPSNVDMPDGCSFHTRCLYCTEKCEKETPGLREFKGRQIACHNAEQVPEWKWQK